MAWKAHIDGGSRGNPGPAAAGFVVRNEAGQTVLAAGCVLGRMTNNQAEYRGLLLALEALRQAGAQEIEVFSDSELLVRQVTGQYKVKSPELRPLFEEALKRLRAFGASRIGHVRREENTEADKLVNRALDEGRHVFLKDSLGLAPKLVAGLPAPSGRPQQSPRQMELREVEPAAAGVEVRVVQGPQSGACPAGMRKGQVFVFTAVTPADCCVDACAAVVEAVLALQSMSPADLKGAAPMTPRCGRPGCGAVFEVRSSMGR